MADTTVPPEGVVADGVVFVSRSDDVMMWQPSSHLRFVQRADKKILQQAWFGQSWLRQEQEWRDIPLVSDEGNGG